jgi:hypothetical protein
VEDTLSVVSGGMQPETDTATTATANKLRQVFMVGSFFVIVLNCYWVDCYGKFGFQLTLEALVIIYCCIAYMFNGYYAYDSNAPTSFAAIIFVLPSFPDTRKLGYSLPTTMEGLPRWFGYAATL